ncbi:hypothetical protein ScPMuIL_014868 [Solemya velum]
MGFQSFDMREPMSSHKGRKLLIVGLVCSLVIGFTIGILVGHFGIGKESDDGLPSAPGANTGEENPLISDLIMEGINPNNIRDNLKKLTGDVHVAGTPADRQQAEELRLFWEGHGLKANISSYNVLLSYSDDNDPNKAYIYSNDSAQEFETPDRENLTGVNDTFPTPYLAYTPAGNINVTEMVYANYGRLEDFRDLSAIHNISVSGRLVIARFGQISRGEKIRLAEERGALGVILYLDPADYNLNNSKVYPDDWWLPPTGAQRGSTFAGDGDPLTPGYPAIDSAYRYSENTTQPPLPGIPAVTIGYGPAKEFLKIMQGENVPDDWIGGIAVNYTFGPGLLDNKKVGLRTSNRNENRTTYNVFGIIKGSIEPDRYVLLGNHRDSWVYGAIDPTGGTAVMMELSRVMGDLFKSGQWKPRRTIIFCSWGAEEFGLIGSTEWVEEYIKNLGNRAVAYINLDIAVMGNHTLRGLGSPLLYTAMYDAARKVDNPDEDERNAGNHTVFHTWLENHRDPKKTDVPTIGPIGLGSDYASFQMRAGIPCADFRYNYDPKLGIAFYPLYHTAFETFHLLDSIMDRNFEFHSAVGKVCGEILRSLSDSVILPFNMSDYADKLTDMYDSLNTTHGDTLRQRDIRLDYLDEAISQFSTEAIAFNTKVGNIDKTNLVETRMVNDQMMQIERSFLDPSGLPGQPMYRHVIQTSSVFSGDSFPGLVDTIANAETDDTEDRWEVVKQHLSVVTFTIQSAASTLRDVTDFISAVET